MYFYHVIPHHFPSQMTRYSSLCYTAGFHCFTTPKVNIVCIFNPRLLVYPTSSPSPMATSLFSKPLSFFSVESFICAIYKIPHTSDIIWYFFLFLTYFTQCESLVPTMLLEMELFCSFLWLNSIPLCIYTISS